MKPINLRDLFFGKIPDLHKDLEITEDHDFLYDVRNTQITIHYIDFHVLLYKELKNQVKKELNA